MTENTNILPDDVTPISTEEALPVQSDFIDIGAIIEKKNADRSSSKRQKTNTNATFESDGLSPLERMRRDTEQKGVVVETKEVTTSENPSHLKAVEEDRRNDDLKKYIAENDMTMERRKNCVVIKPPQNREELFLMMEEIDSLVLPTDTTAAYFEFKEDTSEIGPDGNSVNKTIINRERQPVFVRVRTANDPVYDDKADARAYHAIQDEISKKEEDTKKEVERATSVKIIIDKTSMGCNYEFTEEEKAKLIEAEEIKLVEVKTVSLNTLKIKKRDKSFQEVVKEHEISNAKTTICFPGSGIRASMTGLSYGELGDVALSMDSVTSDLYNKRLTVVYNHMKNISTGPFPTYEEFLKNFAYTDIPLALYGLYIASFPEFSTMTLRCGHKDCLKSFEHKFANRSILKLDACPDVLLEKMEELARPEQMNSDVIKASSAVANAKCIQLPTTGIIVHMGIISAYEFIYNFIPILDEKTFENTFGKDFNKEFAGDFLLLSTIHAIYVPTDDGEYYECDNFIDIMHALFKVSPEETKYLRTYGYKLMGDYQAVFGLSDVECPHCHTKTDLIDMNMDDLLFQTLRRLVTTTVDVESMQDL